MTQRRLLAPLVLLSISLLLSIGVAQLLGLSSRAPEAQAQAPPGDPTLEWFGWSHFRITSTDGTVILINPFITGNPDASVKLEDITRADIILAADGHGDEQGDTIPIAKKTGARVIAGGFELGSWFAQKGVATSQVIRSNPGNFHDFGPIKVRVVNSVHGSGLPAPTIETPYGGPAAGFFITLANGFTIYFAGSTAATMDMELWGTAYKPDLVILPLNGNREPMDVAMMVMLLSKNNPNLRQVIPHHQRVVQPPGATTIDQMEEAIRAIGSEVAVLRLERGQPMSLVKPGS